MLIQNNLKSWTTYTIICLFTYIFLVKYSNHNSLSSHFNAQPFK